MTYGVVIGMPGPIGNFFYFFLCSNSFYAEDRY